MWKKQNSIGIAQFIKTIVLALFMAGTIVSVYAQDDDIIPMDIVINEILSNPQERGGEYIELYNRSNQTISLSSLKLGTNKNGKQTFYAIDTNYQFKPQTYCVLTKHKDLVLRYYEVLNPWDVIEMPKFPAYNNASGIVLLATTTGENIDSVAYNETMHTGTHSSYKGIAFERINPDLPSTLRENWASAASTAMYGTPTAKNSQYQPTKPDNDLTLSLPELFSPDGDGYEDELLITCQAGHPDYRISIKIYNAKGVEVAHLVNNQTIGTENTFKWNGRGKHEELLPIGIYIVYVEAWRPTGGTKHMRKAVTIARHL